MAAVKAPSGRRIWKAVRDELMLNLYPLPYSTIAPAVYHVYLHPEDFESIEPVAPRIVAQIQRALADEVQKLNRGLERSNRRVLSRLLIGRHCRRWRFRPRDGRFTSRRTETASSIAGNSESSRPWPCPRRSGTAARRPRGS